MSEDLVNQITLNFLISKSQLEKLNKKMKYDADNKKKTSIEVYGPRIKELFNNLLDNEAPPNLLQDVKTGFDFFLEKCIYYFKIHDDNANLEDDVSSVVVEHYENDKLDGEEDDDGDVEDGEEDGEEDDDELEDVEDELEDVKEHPVINIKQKIRNPKYKTNETQQLPLEWFQQIRQNYKQNQILPRIK